MSKGVSADEEVRHQMLPGGETRAAAAAEHRLGIATLRAGEPSRPPVGVFAPGPTRSMENRRCRRLETNTGVSQDAVKLVAVSKMGGELGVDRLAQYDRSGLVRLGQELCCPRPVCGSRDEQVQQDVRIDSADHRPRISSTSSSGFRPASCLRYPRYFSKGEVRTRFWTR